MSHILIVFEKPLVREELSGLLEQKGYQVSGASSGKEALNRLDEDGVDLILADMWIKDRSVGMKILEEVKGREATVETILFMEHGRIQSAVEAVKNGAYDVLEKPFDREMLLLSVRRALERKRLKNQVRHLSSVLRRRYHVEGFVYRSQEMEEILKLVQRVSQVDATVLIEGESGTGKELISRAIHARSPRKTGPFHVIDCGTIPENLLESEFFGYRKGAFTGAVTSRKGLFEASSGGTVLLDEISELPFSLQVKLLRVLQEREIRPLGSDSPRKVDVRIVAATNRNLKEEVGNGSFREDLFYRLNVISIRVPSLRERTDDILPLAEYFLQKYGRKLGIAPMRIDSAAAHVLLRYNWPGNVRELENAIQRAVALASGDTLRPEDLPESIRGEMVVPDLSLDTGGTLEEMEKRYVLQVLKLQSGNRGRTAKVLGIGRNTLWRKLRAYGYSDEEDSQK